MKDAKVVTLSPSQQAVIAFHQSGKPHSLLLVRGKDAWPMNGAEAEKLRVALGMRVGEEPQ